MKWLELEEAMLAISTKFTGPSIYPYLLIITVATVGQLI